MIDDNEEEEELEEDEPEPLVPEPKEQPKSKQKAVEGDKRSSQIIQKIFEKLGKPKDLFKYSVAHLYGNRFRVNIYRRDSHSLCFEAGRNTDSFFIHVSPEGEITYANPEIVQKY